LETMRGLCGTTLHTERIVTPQGEIRISNEADFERMRRESWDAPQGWGGDLIDREIDGPLEEQNIDEVMNRVQACLAVSTGTRLAAHSGGSAS
jgi:hypothetical protein